MEKSQRPLVPELELRYPPRPPRPNPAIEIDSAVEYIRWHADALQRHGLNGGSASLAEEDDKHSHLLQRAIRDCGWCIYIQYGDEGVKELAASAIAGLINPYRFELKHLIDHSLHGIGLWKTYGAA
jgi:hypothetical protein